MGEYDYERARQIARDLEHFYQVVDFVVVLGCLIFGFVLTCNLIDTLARDRRHR